MNSINRLTNNNSSLQHRAFTKRPLSFREQVDLLETRGMIINDKDAVCFLLQHINYYRLEAYWFTYYDTNVSGHCFYPGTSFSAIWRDYCFDQKLRLHVLQGLECIEVSFKTQFAYILAHNYGPFPLLKNNFIFGQSEWDEKISMLKEECAKSKEQFAEHLRTTYGCEIFPVWALVEIVSFGTVATLYSNMKHMSVMKQIGRTYGLQPEILCSWLRHLSIIRNICAHHSRLWNRRFVKTPKDAVSIRQDIKECWQYAPKQTDASNPRNDRRIFNTFLIIDYLLSNIDSSTNANKDWKPTLVRQYEVTSQFANRGFTEHTGNNKIICMRLPHANGGHYEHSNPHWHRCPQGLLLALRL
jgi:abortive infection bacteriophage resistance protein